MKVTIGNSKSAYLLTS